jgi:hypothetical protein
MSFRDIATGWTFLVGDLASAISGRAANAIEAAYTHALVAGQDNSGAAVLRPVEARNFDVDADITQSLIGLLVNSRTGLYDINAEYARLGGTSSVTVGGTFAEKMVGALVYQARDTGFAAARRGKRFYTCNPAIGTPLTCQLAYVATTPSLVVRVNVATIRVILRSLKLQIANTPGAIVNYAITLSLSDLWSAGGTLVASSNTNEESATAAAALYYENPTTTGAGARIIDQGVISNIATAERTIKFEDSLLMGISHATVSVYLWSATTAPQVYYNFDAEEVS